MKTARSSRAFTLIEIMLVVAILGVVLTFSAPSIFKAVIRSPLTSAVVDITEQCQNARFQAVIRGVPAELRVYGDGRLEVGLAPRDTSQDSYDTNQIHAGATSEPALPVGNTSSVQISDQVRIDEVDVNFIDMKNSDVARVHFYPDGTCDEFTIIVSADGERRKITLEVVTALADVQPF